MNRDDIIRMAMDSGMSVIGATSGLYDNSIAEGRISDLERFANLVAASEREECAKVCEGEAKRWESPSHGNAAAKMCAADIRVRGQS